MKAIDFARHALESSKGWAMGLLDDMKDSPLTQPTSNGGNHPLWVLGHIVYSEASLLDGFVLGQPNRYAEWESLFANGTTPSTNADDYPSMEELFGKFEEVRAATLAHLDTLSDDDLDQKSHAPEEFSAFFGTVGACYAAMASHVSFHAGQVADARRAAGRAPMMA